MENKKIFDYALLADAAYSKFEKDEKGFSKVYKNILRDEGDKNDSKPNAYRDYILGKEGGEKNYEVIAQWRDRGGEGESGFSAVLFKNASNNEYVLSIRGTGINYKDLIETDIGDIFANGIGYKQIIDLYNFWQQISAEHMVKTDSSTENKETKDEKIYQVAVFDKLSGLKQNLRTLKNAISFAEGDPTISPEEIKSLQE